MHKSEVSKDKSAIEIVYTHTVGYWGLFSEGDTCTKAMAIVAILLSMAGGVLQGMMPKVLGQAAVELGTKVGQDRVNAAATVSYMCLAIGFTAVAVTTICKVCWSYVVQNLETTMRKSYFRAILNQECEWFDVISPDKITQMYNIDGNNYVRGIGPANQMALFSLGQVITGVCLAFSTAVIYTMICLSLVPIMLLGLSAFLFAITMAQTLSKASYVQAGSLSEQSISGIRTVKSLCGEERELELYSNAIRGAKDILVKYGFMKGAGFGTLFLCIMLNYGLGLWSGGTLVKDQRTNPNTGDPMTVGDVVTTFFACLTGFMSLGMVSPSIQKIQIAREAAYSIYEVIHAKPKIAETDPQGKKPKKMNGEIEFKNVKFNYPSRPGIKILENLSFKIPHGTKVAFVGESGCGKSTTVQLIERFYDPIEGEVLIDGTNLKEYDLQALRKYVGYVGQEPVLFAMSIRENLLLAKPNATEEELISCLKKANAWNFVSNFSEKGLDTFVGTGGSQLSGGQKQRLAIARAMLQDPPILLLDESTSALDRKNEREIQETLDQFAAGRTTVLIAHRLSTIKNADIIFVLRDGKVLESGSHSMLMKKDGDQDYLYWKLVRSQEVNLDDHKNTEAKEHEEDYHIDDIDINQMPGNQDMSLADPLAQKFVANVSKKQSFDEIIVQPQSFEKVSGKAAYDKLRKDSLQKQESFSKYSQAAGEDDNMSLRDFNDMSDIRSQNHSFRNVESFSHLNIGQSVSDLRQSNTNKGSFLLPTHVTGSDGKTSQKVQYGRIWADMEGLKAAAFASYFSAICVGSINPIQGFFFGDILATIARIQVAAALGTTDSEAESQLNTILYVFLLLSVFAFALNTLDMGFGSYVGENYTEKLRTRFYKKMLDFDIEFFDHPDNNPSLIASTLDQDTVYVNQLLTTTLSTLLKMTSMVVVGITLAFSASWRIS